MPALPTLIAPTSLPEPTAPLVEKAKAFARNARAENTRRAYRAAWQDFAAWCEEREAVALPATPAVVGLYLTDRATTHKVASLRLRVAAIRQAHALAGHTIDTGARACREVLAGIVRTLGTAPAKKEAAVVEIVRQAVRALAAAPGLHPLRDRALLLVGFAAALRRSELVALDLADVSFTAEGMVLGCGTVR